MSALASCLEDYLALRRSLGYKLERTGDVLAGFVAHLDDEGIEHVTVEAALAWATRSSAASARWQAAQLGSVRCLARYAQALDPGHEVPPKGLLPPGGPRPAPYLFSDADVATLMDASRRLRTPLRALTLHTVIGLLAATGIRVGETLRLDRADLDTGRGLLTIRRSKAGTSRVIPLHPSTVAALDAYLVRRDTLGVATSTPAMFVSRRGSRLRAGSLRSAFCEVVELAGLPARSRQGGPRLADLRHRFAVVTLTRWHAEGLEVEALVPLLSAYLGHATPASTYWYLSASPPLLEAAVRRLERRAGGRR